MNLKDQSLQQAVTQVISHNNQYQNTQNQCPVFDNNITFDVPLGMGLSMILKNKIINSQYVELLTLLELGTDDDVDDRRKAKFPRKVRDVNQWLSAMLIYGALYLPTHTHEIPDFFKYLDMIRNMASQTVSFAWRNYDETFRRAREAQPLPWDRPLIHQYVGAMLSTEKTSNSQRTLFQTNPFFHQVGIHVPKPYCFMYNSLQL